MTATDTPDRKSNPPVLGGVAPYLGLSDAGAATDFYKKAFGAIEANRVAPDAQGRHMHIHLVINGGSVLLMDFFPEHGYPFEAPQAFNLHLQVDDIDAWWNRAVAAGAEIKMPVALMFWGDRYGQLRDPFGVTWALGSSVGN